MNLGTVMSPRSRRLQNSTQTKYIPARPSEPRSHDSPTHRADAVPTFLALSLHFITFFTLSNPSLNILRGQPVTFIARSPVAPKREHFVTLFNISI